MKPKRLTRIVFRIGAALCVLLVVATVASFWRSFNVRVAGNLFSVNHGSVCMVIRFPILTRSAWIGPANNKLRLWMAKWSHPYNRSKGFVTMRSYPTWMFLLATLIPTFLAWRRLPRPVPGHCHQCGYDLTGNVTGVCSECGEGVVSKVPID